MLLKAKPIRSNRMPSLTQLLTDEHTLYRAVELLGSELLALLTSRGGDVRESDRL